MKYLRRRLLIAVVPVLLLLMMVPTVPVSAAPGLPHTFRGTAKIAGVDAPIGTVISARVNGTEYGSATTTVVGQYSLSVTGLTDGTTIRFFMNSQDTGQSRSFISGATTDPFNLNLADTVAPAVTITALSPDPSNDNTPTFTGTATDAMSNITSVEFRVDAGAWTAATASDGTFNSLSEGYTFTTPALADGAHTVSVRATDSNSNTTAEASYASDAFTIDATAPTVTINAVTSPTNASTQTISGTRESGATISMSSTTGTTFGAVSTPTATTWSVVATLVSGSNSITATASDAAGNTATATATIVLDTTAPTVAINAVTSPTNASTQAISGTRESGATISMSSTTGTTFGAVSTPTATTWSVLATLVAGSNSITATATDGVGNTATASATIVLDTTAPTVAINTVTSPTNAGTQTITGTMESGATVAMSSTTGTTFGAVSYPTSTTWSAVATLVSGSNSVTATASDAAGNTATATATIVFEAAVTINTVTTPTNQTTQVLTGTRTSGATVVLTADTAATFTTVATPTATTWSSTVTLVEGSNTITATVGTGTASATIVRDTVAPAVQSVSPLSGATGVAVGTTVTATFSEAMTSSSIAVTSFTLASGSSVTGTVSYNASTRTATFTPAAALAIGTTYTATLGAAITDAAGNPLAAYSWSFTTAAGNLATELGNVAAGGTIQLGSGTYSGNVTIDKPVTITGTSGTVIQGGITIGALTGSTVVIENLTINNYTSAGIHIVKARSVDTFTIRNNVIQGGAGSVAGILVDEVETGGTVTIERNTITGNQTGIKLLAAVRSATIRRNDISGNSASGVEAAAGGSANAAQNWWGNVSGPKHEGSFSNGSANQGGSGNKLLGDIAYEPWLTRSYQTVIADNIAYYGYAWVSLAAGWNTLSIPVAPDPAADTWGEYVALGDGLAIDTAASAYTFDGDNQAWVVVTSSYQIKPLDAIYVKMAAADTAPVLVSPGLSVPAKQLYHGWNLVGPSYMGTGQGEYAALQFSQALDSARLVTGGLAGFSLVVSPPLNQTAWALTSSGSAATWNGQGQAPSGWMARTYGYWVFMLNDGTLAGLAFTPISLGN